MPLPEVCVVYLLRTSVSGHAEVLLGRKKTGLGVGKLVGIGGKLEAGESPPVATVREALEETGIVIRADNLRAAGIIDYHFPTRPSWSQRSHVFVCTRWMGEATETDELDPSWFDLSEIPFDSMWDDARFWLDGVLAGSDIHSTFTFGPDLATVVGRATELAWPRRVDD